jgi:hypothetical protein
MTKNDKDWLKFLNPQTFYRNFILSSLYITSYDLLKNSIISQIESFYTTSWDSNGPHVGEEYKKEVLGLDLKKNKLNASVKWLKKHNAIDDNDIKVFEEITLHRNELAHETFKILTDSEKDINFDLFVEIKRLLKKVDQWFILEIELPTNPDMTVEKYDTIDRDNVQSMNMIMLDYMVNSIFNPSENTTELYEQFKKDLSIKYGNIDK